MRTLNHGGNQGRGDPPAFHVRTHRVVETNQPTGEPSYRFWACVGGIVFLAVLCFIAISLKGGAS